MAKLDIFKTAWIDVVFAGRNQAYGAYELRKLNSWNTTKALMIGGTIFILAISTPLILKYVKGLTPEDKEKLIETEVILTPPPPVDENTPPPPPPVEPPRPKVDQIRFPPPVVVPKEEVRDEEPPTVEELKVADPGQKTIEGDPTQEVRIEEPVGEAPVGSQVTEDNSIHSVATIEVMPKYPGGMDEFYKWVGRTYEYPTSAREAGVSGRLTVSFVVEKDGSLTDIKVLKDLGHGTGDVAKRMLMKSKKWEPGIQNGRPVRVQYTLPLMLQMEAQ
ncbi:energy transducer TonB [Paradesertivirga mongoliensis]|uniref:Energy transducer TonB n=1 Tax=Paradesertivirga mongoliensis TaxID=2100740 RepID=A0ABW4ZIR6_9SPHI|nr:energy transducer TonB [Pedobacter mongoliensis]